MIVIVNNEQSEVVITNEDEYYGLIRQNDKKDGLHNVENVLQYAKNDRD